MLDYGVARIAGIGTLRRSSSELNIEHSIAPALEI